MVGIVGFLLAVRVQSRPALGVWSGGLYGGCITDQRETGSEEMDGTRKVFTNFKACKHFLTEPLNEYMNLKMSFSCPL